MTPGVLWSVAALAAYLLGAVPFGLVIGKAWKGVDIRQHGSGNLGATNALRVLGKKVGALVLVLDALKGLAPVLGAPPLLAAAGAPAPGWLPVVLGLTAVLGHVFPVYLGFRGGKGVATSAGAFLALHPSAFGVALAVFLLTLAATRMVSLGSVLAAVALPLAAVALDGRAAALEGEGRARTALFLLAGLLVIVRHRANLGRIRAGTEPRLGARASSPAAGPSPDAAPTPDEPAPLGG